MLKNENKNNQAVIDGIMTQGGQRLKKKLHAHAKDQILIKQNQFKNKGLQSGDENSQNTSLNRNKSYSN